MVKSWLEKILCKDTQRNGQPCTMPRMKGSDLCVNHNPEIMARRGRKKYCHLSGEELTKIRSEATKKVWARPGHKEKMGLIMSKVVRKQMPAISKYWLYQKYRVEELTAKQIAILCGCSASYVLKMMGEYEIERGKRRKPTEKQKEAIRKRMKKKFQEPEYKAWHRKMVKEIANRPEIKAKKREALAKRWQDPEFKKRIVETRKIQNPLVRIGVHCGNKDCEDIVFLNINDYLRRDKKKGLFKRPHCSCECFWRDAKNSNFVDFKGGVSWCKGLSKETDERLAEVSKVMKQKWQDPNSIFNSPEYKRKQSESRKGEKNPAWNGGTSFEPYGYEFNKELRLEIRQRDEFICQLCGATENGRAFGPHHINYRKKDNEKRNLTLLCIGCNVKVNCDREKWELCFTVLNEIRRL